MKEESDFGKGLVICLVKFAEHFMKLQTDILMYEKMREKSPNLFDEGCAVQLWLNGASDHLYEIEVPKGKDWDKIRKKVKALQDEGLEGGHGFVILSKIKREEANKLMSLTREIALMIDKKLGLKAEKGQF